MSKSLLFAVAIAVLSGVAYMAQAEKLADALCAKDELSGDEVSKIVTSQLMA